MTRRATLTQAAIDRATKAARRDRMKVEITAPDGTVYTFTPVLDAGPESPEAAKPKKWPTRGKAHAG